MGLKNRFPSDLDGPASWPRVPAFNAARHPGWPMPRLDRHLHGTPATIGAPRLRRGSVLGSLAGVLLVAVTQDGLALPGVSPCAVRTVVGAISTPGLGLVREKPRKAQA